MARPAPLGTIYVENGVGRAITNFLNAHARDHGLHAVFQHDFHPRAQSAQRSDVWWIEAVTDEGWHILTRDLRLLRNPDHKVGLGVEAHPTRVVQPLISINGRTPP
jgi:PIN like domain